MYLNMDYIPDKILLNIFKYLDIVYNIFIVHSRFNYITKYIISCYTDYIVCTFNNNTLYFSNENNKKLFSSTDINICDFIL